MHLSVLFDRTCTSHFINIALSGFILYPNTMEHPPRARPQGRGPRRQALVSCPSSQEDRRPTHVTTLEPTLGTSAPGAAMFFV